MRIKLLPTILFFIVYFWAYAIFNAINAKADEPELSCETFINEKICKMTPVEQENFFLEMFKALIDQKLNESEVESADICLKETEQGKLIPCEGVDV